MKYRYALAGIVLTAALVGGIFLMRKRHSVSSPSQSQADLPKAKGSQNAPVEMIEYSDFQCPACQRAEPTIQKLLEAHPGKIHFVFRHFPLPGHRWSAVAHQAAECAAQKGKFWEFHDRLYANQPVWAQAPNAVEFFLQYAGELGMNIEPFANCLTDSDINQKVLKDKKSGERLQINSTPTFSMNKERLVGPVELEQKGEEVIRRILGEPPTPAPALTPSPAAPLPSAAPAALSAPSASDSKK